MIIKFILMDEIEFSDSVCLWIDKDSGNTGEMFNYCYEISTMT
ncbi:hypothetical protein CIT292_06116 [Citrobacter youngae ATCC 29220]|uniref:Uncharacterized protein n=1 Tax=Citrobacter youngae ATCC 29220 TaxID=500640 RepID=D4B721_9ENTR|nr:hypothetical protein CIT292_06116 [Citrobacter youngae ATCC 29220]